MTDRIPEYRFGGHYLAPSRMHLTVSRVDGLPTYDERGERLAQDGLTLDELLGELRLLIERMRAFDDLGPVALAPSPRILTIGEDRFQGPLDQPEPGS